MSYTSLLGDYLGTGTDAGKPSAAMLGPTIPAGSAAYYYATDTGKLYVVYGGGTAWALANIPATLDTDVTLAANSDTRVASQKAVKSYVDAAVTGLSWKQAVRAASTANGTLATAYANGQVIDGVTLATGDRILIKNQTTGSENGIYIVAASGAPARSTDADTGAELVNATCYVSEGSSQADTQWTCSTNAPITVGTTSLTFAQLSSGGGSGSITSSGYTQNTAKILGRTTASAGAIEEISVGTGLTLSAGTLSATGGGGGGGMTLIGSQTATGSESTLTVSSISTSYNNMRIVVYGSSASNGQSIIRLNNDSGSNYDWQEWNSGGTSGGASQSSIAACYLSAFASTYAAQEIFDIAMYADTNFYKCFFGTKPQVHDLSTDSNFYSVSIAGHYRSTSAISRVDWITGAGTFRSGSKLMVYGY